MKTKTESTGKPRLALLIATGFGLGYLPIAPGTWGSLGGLALYMLVWKLCTSGMQMAAREGAEVLPPPGLCFLLFQCWIIPMLGALGIWTAGRAAKYLGEPDPRRVVIDEVSGQHIALVFGGFLPAIRRLSAPTWDAFIRGLTSWNPPLNWKYLLLGLILFRVFDIWKPFPARQAESLPGGWGIMADDWYAAFYAAVVLWLARGLGL